VQPPVAHAPSAVVTAPMQDLAFHRNKGGSVIMPMVPSAAQ